MAAAWYTNHITQAFGQNGEKGVDLGMPVGTPITALYAGTVTWAGRTQWACGSSGGQVCIVCSVPGLGTMTSYYLHMDTVLVKVGDKVSAGQQIATSGGQLSGGNMPVVNCKPGVPGYKGSVVTYSTGAHMEFGFNAPWVSGPGRNIDPTFAISAAKSGTLNLAFSPPPGAAPGGPPSTTGGQTNAAPLGPIQSGQLPVDVSIQNLADLSAKTHRVLNQYEGFESIAASLQLAITTPQWNSLNPFGSFFALIKPWFIRLFFALIGLFIIVFVLWEYIRAAQQKVSQSVQIAGSSLGGTASGGGELAAAPEVAAL